MTGCIVGDCTKPIVRREMCNAHYRRVLRHGDPLIVLKAGGSRPTHIGCLFPGCHRPHRARGWCARHYRLWRRHENRPVTPPVARVVAPVVVTRTATSFVAYYALRRQLWRILGQPSGRCDCGDLAQEWSYDGTDPDPLSAPGGVIYSLDTGRYVAQCRDCHWLTAVRRERQ